MNRILRSIVLMAAVAVVGGRLRRLVTRRGPSEAVRGPAGAGGRQARRVGGRGGHRTGTATWRHRLVTIGVFILVMTGGGVLVLVSGVVPIKASSGHWGVTQSLLDFAKRRSVVAHSMGIKAPSLDEPALVLRGAGHYETGCRPCHGAPGVPRPVVALHMTAPPPDLVTRIPRWKPHHLFYIVKHGIKFTGMPAWPAARRDDEVWAMVAFLRRLPELTDAQYRRLANGDAEGPGEISMSDLAVPQRSTPEPPADLERSAEGLRTPRRRTLTIPETVAGSCARCHGSDGAGRGTGAFPRLAGQSPIYVFAALRAYARGDRHSGIMRSVAADLSVAEMRELARYYSRLAPGADSFQPEGGASTARGAPEASAGGNSGSVHPELRGAPDASAEATGNGRAAIARGAEIARRGAPAQGVPSCRDCHGPTDLLRNPFYPSLSGQYRDYLVLQLELFRDGRRGGSPYAHLMDLVASRLTPEQMRDVATYYESLSVRMDDH